MMETRCCTSALDTSFLFLCFFTVQYGSWTCFTYHTPRGGLGITTATSGMKERGGLGGGQGRVAGRLCSATIVLYGTRGALAYVRGNHRAHPRATSLPHDPSDVPRASWGMRSSYTYRVDHTSAFQASRILGVPARPGMWKNRFFCAYLPLAVSKWQFRVCSANLGFSVPEMSLLLVPYSSSK